LIASSAIAIGALSVVAGVAGVVVFATRANGNRADGTATSGLIVAPTRFDFAL
jgi:hypothetical protein